MDLDQRRQKGRDINEMLKLSSSTWSSFANETDGTMIWNLLNKLVFILGDDAPTFASAWAGDRDSVGGRPTKVVVFTEDYLLYVDGDVENNYMDVAVVPRRNLERFDVVSAPQVMDDAASNNWGNPNKSLYKLTYKHGYQFNLPLGPGASNSGMREIDSLIQSFKDQLIENSAASRQDALR